MFMKTCLYFLFLAISTQVWAKPFWEERENLELEEEEMQIGHEILLNIKEIKVNKILMQAKEKDFDKGYENPEKFLAAQHFFKAKTKIEKSKVFKIIRKMPKGALLHCHDSAGVSEDFMFNLTYKDDLYACVGDASADFIFWFSLHPPVLEGYTCNLMSELRAKSEDLVKFNAEIKARMTIFVDNPVEEYPTMKSVWDRFEKIFDFVTPIISFRPVFEEWFYQILLELYEDNVFYAEFRTGLHTLYELDGTEHDYSATVFLYKRVVDKFMNDHPDFVGARLIFAKARFKDSIDKYVEIYKSIKEEFPDFIAGFDLVGNEDTGNPISKYIDDLQKFPAGTKFFFHAGETKWYGEPADMDLLDSVLLNTTRIGHAYALLKHPRVMQIVKERGIGLEISPISNNVLMLVDDLRNHPAAGLMAQDFPLVITNDDPGFWGARALSYDWYEAYMAMTSRTADLRTLKQLALNSITYSAMPEKEKTEAFVKFNQAWEKFLDQ